MDNKIIKFIQEHINDDVLKLSLQSHRYPDIDMQFAIRQIVGLQKTKNKMPSLYNNLNLLFPRQLSIEQSSSEITAKYKASLFRGESFADLSGGFGIDYLFISQKFKHGLYVERNEELCRLAANNFKILEIDSFEIHHADSDKFLEIMPRVDLIYIDPHRRSESGKKTIKISDCEPDVSVLCGKMLAKSQNVMIKLSPMLDIHQAISELSKIKEIHILSVENECKETLLILDGNINEESDYNSNSIRIITNNFDKYGTNQVFSFTLDDEKKSEVQFASYPEHYLYEPNSSIMKSGAFRTISSRFGLRKFHVNTHLYTGDKLINDFPGRIFKIDKVFGSTKSDLKKIAVQIPKANISIRNYPLSVEEFKRKTGIKDGGDVYLFALQDNTNKFTILACQKVVI
ncbi:hypothetical protein MASR2M117_06260 [Paludibacter sp.]